MSETIRFGISGSNYAKEHAAALSQIDGVALTALAECEESARNELIDTFSIEHRFDTHMEMTQSGTVDAVIVCLPNHARERAVGNAFDADLHVLSESPPSLNESEMSRIVSSAGFCGKVYMWSMPQRFSPLISGARKLIESGELGDIYRAESTCRLGWWPYDDDNWRGSVESGGGALLNLGPQAIDALWYSMGCPDPVEAIAAGHNLHLKEIVPDPDYVADDSVFGMIRFKNGASLSLAAAYFGHFAGHGPESNPPKDQSQLLFGTNGSIDLMKGEKTIAKKPEAQVNRYCASNPGPDYVAQAEEFVASIREDRDPINSGKDALALMKMLDALALSAKEKKAISIKTARDLDDLFGGL